MKSGAVLESLGKYEEKVKMGDLLEREKGLK